MHENLKHRATHTHTHTQTYTHNIYRKVIDLMYNAYNCGPMDGKMVENKKYCLLYVICTLSYANLACTSSVYTLKFQGS